jgi:coenzyme F420-reducing hydrogenase alpha subunit
MTEPQGKTSRTISVQALARVEGEGGLTIRLRDGQVEGVELRIYEPPRFYEALDFLGYESAIAMAQSSPELAAVVRHALRIKKAGNRIVQVVGGREVHPINVRVGGFYRAPRCDELTALVEELKWARNGALGSPAAVPRLHGRLRVRRPATSGRVPHE